MRSCRLTGTRREKGHLSNLRASTGSLLTGVFQLSALMKRGAGSSRELPAAWANHSPFWMIFWACFLTRALRRNRHSLSLRIWLSKSCSSGIFQCMNIFTTQNNSNHQNSRNYLCNTHSHTCTPISALNSSGSPASGSKQRSSWDTLRD